MARKTADRPIPMTTRRQTRGGVRHRRNGSHARGRGAKLGRNLAL